MGPQFDVFVVGDLSVFHGIGQRPQGVQDDFAKLNPKKENKRPHPGLLEKKTRRSSKASFKKEARFQSSGDHRTQKAIEQCL